jgi:hypothetical protein
MSALYRHTQVGWAMLVAAAAILALGWAGLPADAAEAARVPLLLVAALLVFVFGTLTVEVGAEAIRLRFGVGLVRRTIPLRDVMGWREVRNPWYSGWGIRLGPGVVLWNVSGFDAVELTFREGKRFRVGTDEPAALAAAIAGVKGAPAAESAAPGAAPSAPGSVRAWGPWALVLVLGVLAVGGLFWLQIRPPSVKIHQQGFDVETLFFGRSFSAADIVSISLEQTLPPVRRKLNGFDGAGTLRGRFRIEGLGDGRLFVELGYPPYLLVRLREGFVVVNFREPEKTRALHDEMSRVWPDRVAAPTP